MEWYISRADALGGCYGISHRADAMVLENIVATLASANLIDYLFFPPLYTRGLTLFRTLFIFAVRGDTFLLLERLLERLLEFRAKPTPNREADGGVPKRT